MKKIILLIAAALTVCSLAACTPTTQKKAEETTAASAKKEDGPPDGSVLETTAPVKADTPELRNVDNSKLPSDTAISVYGKNRAANGLKQHMETLTGTELNAQGILNYMITYEMLPEGTKVLAFEQKGKSATINLSAIPTDGTDLEKEMVLQAIVNTYTENYELDSLIVQVDGKTYTLPSIQSGSDGSMEYNDAYRNLEK